MSKARTTNFRCRIGKHVPAKLTMPASKAVVYLCQNCGKTMREQDYQRHFAKYRSDDMYMDANYNWKRR